MLQFKKRKRDETQLLLAIYWMILLSYCVLKFFFFFMGNTSKTLLINIGSNYILVESLFKETRSLFNPNR